MPIHGWSDVSRTTQLFSQSSLPRVCLEPAQPDQLSKQPALRGMFLRSLIKLARAFPSCLRKWPNQYML